MPKFLVSGSRVEHLQIEVEADSNGLALAAAREEWGNNCFIDNVYRIEDCQDEQC